MSLSYAAMVSGDDVAGPAGSCRVRGPSAFKYFLMVLLWIPNSRSIARSDIPLCLAFWIAFHLSFWRNVGFRGEAEAGLAGYGRAVGVGPLILLVRCP